MRRRLVLGIIALVLVALGVFLWVERPTRVARLAVGGLGSAETQRFNATLELANATASEALVGQSAQVQLLLNGVFKREADQLDSLQTDLVLITATEGLTLRVEAEARFIGDQAYIRIISSPQTFPVLVQLKDKWLALPRGGTKDGESRSPNEAPLFTTVDRVGTEKYQAQATSTAVVGLLDAMANILGTNLTEEQVGNIRQSLTEVNEVPVTLWIAPWSHELRRLAATLTIPGSNIVAFTFEPSERNRPVTISAPTDTVSLDQALQQ